jgi:hypothetical protein
MPIGEALLLRVASSTGVTSMNDMNERERHWSRAARHVYAGRLIVELQRTQIARLAAERRPTYLAEQMLQVFVTTLELLEWWERQYGNWPMLRRKGQIGRLQRFWGRATPSRQMFQASRSVQL